MGWQLRILQHLSQIKLEEKEGRGVWPWQFHDDLGSKMVYKSKHLAREA